MIMKDPANGKALSVLCTTIQRRTWRLEPFPLYVPARFSLRYWLSVLIFESVGYHEDVLISSRASGI